LCNSQSDNRQPLSIAARDDEVRAPVQIMQMYHINSQDRPVDTIHRQNCLVAANATTANSMMTAGPEQQSFVGGLHPLCGGGGRQRRQEAMTLATLCLHPCYWYLLCCVNRIADTLVRVENPLTQDSKIWCQES